MSCLNRKYLKDIFGIENASGKERLDYLDFLRGAAMLLVLLHHSNIPNGHWILAFHMPLFFLISGYADAHLSHLGISHSKNIADYFWNRFKRLVVPYFLFEGANLFVWSVSLILQQSWQDVPDALFAIITCQNTDAYTGYYGRLWFLPCMFVSDIYFYCIKKICKESKIRLLLSAALMLALSWFTCHILTFRLPFAADTAFMATAFLIFGFLFEQQITDLLEKKHFLLDIGFFCAMLLVMRYCIVNKWSYCMMYINQYGPFLWSVVAALSGSFAFLIIVKGFFWLFSKIKFGKNLILWYGYNSLATFPIHLSIKMWLIYRYGWGFPWQYLFIIMLLVNIPIVNVIRIYLPFMLGDFSALKRKQKVAS